MTATVPMQRPAETSDHAPGWALVERVQAGDMDAFGVLWAEHHPQVLRFVAGRVGPSALAEDITADVFYRALRGLQRVTYQGSPVGAWLTTIARNLVADHFKSARYRLEVGGASLEFEGPDHADPAPGPEHIVSTGGVAAQVRIALVCLTEDQRAVIVHRFYRQLSVEDTARAMSREVGATKALQYRAVQALRRFLAADLAELR